MLVIEGQQEVRQHLRQASTSVYHTLRLLGRGTVIEPHYEKACKEVTAARVGLGLPPVKPQIPVFDLRDLLRETRKLYLKASHPTV